MYWGDKILRTQRGSFLMQALLALGVIFSLLPMLARQLSSSAIDTRMYSATRQVDIAQTAARIFIRENATVLPFDTTVVAGNDFVDLLEPYGLPLGFVPRTALGQDISLVITKTPVAVSAYLNLKGGKLNGIQRAELVRRIGFYALDSADTIKVGIELQDVYSDVVRRNDTNLDNAGFLTNLDMGGYSLNNVATMFALTGEFASGQFNTISIGGTESGRKEKNKIGSIKTNRAVFQSQNGETALTLTRGTLYTNTTSTQTISLFGDTGNFTAVDASVRDFSMTAGRTSFTGGEKWNVHGSVIADRINFSVERLDISSYLTTTRGQDVFVDEETLDYVSRSGVDADYIYASNITMYDQTSAGLESGKTGAVVLDVRPAGTSLLPDVLLSTISNDKIDIIKKPDADDDEVVACKSIISDYEGVYNKQSLAQYLICQYVYWQRLEQRINLKQCLMAGGSDCK